MLKIIKARTICFFSGFPEHDQTVQCKVEIFAEKQNVHSFARKSKGNQKVSTQFVLNFFFHNHQIKYRTRAIITRS